MGARLPLRHRPARPRSDAVRGAARMSGATPEGALPPTPSQTVGPFFSFGLEWEDGPFAVAEGTAGAIRIEGTLLDGLAHPIPDGLIETWQADPDGRYAHPDDPRGGVDRDGFRGFARCP